MHVYEHNELMSRERSSALFRRLHNRKAALRVVSSTRNERKSGRRANACALDQKEKITDFTNDAAHSIV